MTDHVEIARDHHQRLHNFLCFLLLEMAKPSVPLDLQKEIILRVLDCHMTSVVRVLGTHCFQGADLKKQEGRDAVVRTLCENVVAINDDDDKERSDIRASLIALLTYTRPGEDYTYLIPDHLEKGSTDASATRKKDSSLRPKNEGRAADGKDSGS